ncbi:MAG: hypothetical protein CMH98_01005 [Oceanospirillaceae bacterium]|nr:hypothetical protein [Oceanospirillaceae bacterium]
MPGDDATFISVFTSGANKWLKPKKKERSKIPLSPGQLFLVILTLTPFFFFSFGFNNGTPTKHFLSSMSVISIMLLLANGLRIGELTTKNQTKHTKDELLQMPRVS